MGERERFEHTEPWGFSPEGSGVRTRPDLQLLIGPRGETLKLDELDSPDTEHMSSTALLAPLAPARPQTQPLTRPIRASSRPSVAPVAQPSVPTRAPSSPPPPVQDAPLQAAVHASVYASVQAVLLAASQVPRTSVVPPAPAPAPVGWTPAQRIYVLATAVALSVMATTIFFLALGPSDVHSSQAPRTARASTASVATLDTTTVGSAARKDPSIVIAVADAPTAHAQPVARRAPSFGPARTASTGALSSTAGAGTAPGSAASASATKLDDAARSAKMLREQLNTAVN